MPVSPEFGSEASGAAESVEPSSTEEHFTPAGAGTTCEDFTEDVEVGGIGEELDEDGLKKKSRHRPRKKKLYADICNQVEFYFSDSNISKNRNMAELVSQAEYVGLHHLLAFNKIQKILPELNITYLQKALAHSQVLELSSDKTGVKRKVPYDETKLKSNEEVEKCTIYVENVPTHVDHEWLEKIFQEFGPIAYVSMPKFKHNGLPKGFAFVEFKDEEGAERCLNAYGDKGACLPSNINPGSLLSVRAFEQPDSSTSPVTSSEAVLSGTSVSSSNGSRKRQRQDTEDSKEEIPAKKEKAETRTGGSAPSDDNEIQSDQVDSSGTQSNGTGDNGVQNSAEKKKRRKNYKTKKLDNIEKRESDSIQLKILPKKIWRQLRNRYLNLQRENLGKLKRQLRPQPGHSRQEQFERSTERRPSAVEQEQTEKSSSGSSKPRSVIARLDFNEPYESEDSFKACISTQVAPQDSPSLIQFIDYSSPDTHAYIRLSADPDLFSAVGEFLRNAASHFRSASILTGNIRVTF